MKTLTTLGGLLVCLSLMAAPASADVGWISATGGTLYRLDTQTGIATPTGTSPDSETSLAAYGSSTVLGVQGDYLSQQLLVEVDPTTGTSTPRGPLDDGLPVVALTTAADGTVYAAATDFGSVSGLYAVDPVTGATSLVGGLQPNPGYTALAGACGGTLLGVDQDNDLVRIDLSTGGSTTLGHIATLPGSYIQALAFDHADGTLWAMSIDDTSEHLMTIDPATAASSSTMYADGQVGTAARGLALDSPAACHYARRLSVIYHARTQKFTGRLRSSWRPCQAGEKVRVFRKVRGPDQRLGTATTTDLGRFTLRKRLVRGSAYAVAAQSSSPTTGTCELARSGLTR